MKDHWPELKALIDVWQVSQEQSPGIGGSHRQKKKKKYIYMGKNYFSGKTQIFYTTSVKLEEEEKIPPKMAPTGLDLIKNWPKLKLN